MTMQYKQLTYEQRCQITVLIKRGFSQREIASTLEVNQSTISRELARNTGKCGYRQKQAHSKAVQRRLEAVKPTRMTPAMISVIESKIRVEWSPEQISGWLLESREQLISHESIYRHIWADSKRAVIFIRTCAVKERSTTSVVMANRHEGILKTV